MINNIKIYYYKSIPERWVKSLTDKVTNWEYILAQYDIEFECFTIGVDGKGYVLQIIPIEMLLFNQDLELLEIYNIPIPKIYRKIPGKKSKYGTYRTRLDYDQLNKKPWNPNIFRAK